MNHLPFYKYQGIGNDFILCDSQDLPIHEDLAQLAQRLCDRHYGIGADGLILREDSEKGHHRMRIINSDGSEPEMCGNGLRCFIVYLKEVHQLSLPEYSIETTAGLMKCSFTQEQWVRVNMGSPILEQALIPAVGFETSPVISQALQAGEAIYDVTLVSMGNPHCVIFVDDLNQIDLRKEGPLIESMSEFPQNTNVEFVKILAPDRAKMIVWERGAGVTMACGTGACAVLVAGNLNQLLDSRSVIELPGGNLEIEWDTQKQIVWMSGPAQLVYQGKIGV